MKRRKITMEDIPLVLSGEITAEDLWYNGFSGEMEYQPVKDGQIKVACVGDSITYGHGIYNWPENNYPKVLGRLLGESYHVQNFGVCGQCVQDCADRPYRGEERFRRSLAYDADIVVFMMGTNDAKVQNWNGAIAFRQALCALLEDYLNKDKIPRIYMCLPATAFYKEGFTENVAMFDIQPAVVEEIASIIRQIAGERGYPVVDIHALTGGNPQWFAVDGIHPDQDGAAAIAREIHDAITASSVL